LEQVRLPGNLNSRLYTAVEMMKFFFRESLFTAGKG
jgi:hypothetical protein